MLLLLLFSYTAFLWDNDGGLEIQDIEFQVGTEVYISKALEDNGIETVVDTALPSIEDLMPFDMLFINCAWRTGEMINEVDRKTISTLIDSSKSVYLEGNYVAEIMSEVDPDFLRKFGVKYDGTESFIYPPVEGFPGTFMQGEVYEYNPFDSLNSNVDLLDTLKGANAEYIYGTQEPGKFILSMGIGGSDYVRKNGYFNHGTVFSSLCLCGLLSHPDDSIFTDSERRMEFTQKILGYFGYGSILVVDDNESEDDKLEWDLDSMGVLYDEYENDAFPDPHLLRSYNVILWTTGFTYKYTIPDTSQWVINDYLDWGGRVFLSGEGIGSDIGIPGQGEESWFLELFGTDYIGDSISADSVFGIEEFDGLRSSLYSPGADLLDIFPGSKVIFEYFPSSTPAGIKKEEARRKTTFLGFAYEGMRDRDSRLELLGETMRGFNFNLARTSGVDEEREENPPETTPYPNPFTHYTIIPTHSNSFEIYSITGRFIKRIEGDKWYGRDSNGNPLPCGIYLFRSKSGERGKVILVR